MIDVDNLHKAYGDAPVLRGASFAVDRGEVAALVGANGTGKTTTLQILAGLVPPDAGQARIDGVNVSTNRRAAQRRLAFLPQDTRFHGTLSPRQVLRFYAGLRDNAAPPIASLLKDVALTDVADDPCTVLSGGMRQRLGLAVVWLSDAPVLLLDEPGRSLDPDWRAYLKRELRRRADEGAAVLMATHLHDLWADLIDIHLVCEAGIIHRDPTGPSAPNSPDDRSIRSSAGDASANGRAETTEDLGDRRSGPP